MVEIEKVKWIAANSKIIFVPTALTDFSLLEVNRIAVYIACESVMRI
jgi:hypothetical protein